ncbi:hypothetical protein BGY98DRAFT_1018070, partial [Russula aff. rugulosa BPL654]
GIYPYAYRPQGLVAVQVSGGSTYPWEQDCTAYFHNPQIREDADSIGLPGYSFVRYGPEIDGYWTRYQEGFQPSSAFLGHEDVPPASIEPFKCSLCDKRFARKQSVGRHYRKRHDANKCLFSSHGCKFTWGGPYDYRPHLKGQHKLKNEVINRILGKTTESRCRATIAGRKPFPPPLFPLYTTD